MTPDDLRRAYAGAPDPPALRGLSAAADWPALRHAHGSAADVPALLRALVADDPDHRRFALETLCETIWHQGTVYEATAAVVPLLYDLLEAGAAVPDREFAAFLVAVVADGSGYRESQHAPRPEDAVRESVARRLDLLVPYLRHADPAFRATIVTAFSRVPEAVVGFLPELRAARESEPDGHVREELDGVIRRLSERRRRIGNE